MGTQAQPYLPCWRQSLHKIAPACISRSRQCSVLAAEHRAQEGALHQRLILPLQCSCTERAERAKPFHVLLQNQFPSHSLEKLLPPCSLEPSTDVQCPPRMCCHLHTYFPPQPPTASPSCILGHHITPCVTTAVTSFSVTGGLLILGYSPLTCTSNPSGCNMGNHRVRPGQD